MLGFAGDDVHRFALEFLAVSGGRPEATRAAVHFMLLESNLPRDTLAHVWTLAAASFSSFSLGAVET